MDHMHINGHRVIATVNTISLNKSMSQSNSRHTMCKITETHRDGQDMENFTHTV